jgi:thiamine pyrophosphokinase
VRALVVADGEAPSRAALDEAWPGWADGVDLVVAADGGANGALALGLRIDLVVGDMDSLAPERLAELEAAGVAAERAPAEKDESDTELAILAAIRRGAGDLTVVGAFGGPRLDHLLANVALLAHPALGGRDVRLVDGRTRVGLVVAPAADGSPVRRTLAGRAGDLVSLIPFGEDAVGVTTAGLDYPLSGGTLAAGPARGISNRRAAAVASVELERGRLLVVETLPPG